MEINIDKLITVPKLIMMCVFVIVLTGCIFVIGSAGIKVDLMGFKIEGAPPAQTAVEQTMELPKARSLE
jgi:hypothetical protein